MFVNISNNRGLNMLKVENFTVAVGSNAEDVHEATHMRNLTGEFLTEKYFKKLIV
jgi:hypothetical protein